LTLTHEEVIKYIESFDKESKAIKDEALHFCWYMRGGLTYNEAMMLGQEERNIISKIIKDNLETTKESGLPFF